MPSGPLVSSKERGAQLNGAIKDHYVAQRARANAPPPFDPTKSLWEGRLWSSDAHSLYDTEEVRRSRFAHDWQRALSLGIEKMIAKYDDDAEADLDGDGIPDEVAETGQALWMSSDLTEYLFTCYACGSADAAGRSDIGAIGFNQWGAFVSEYELLDSKSRYLKRADLDRIFLSIDALAARKEREERLRTGAKEAAASERVKALNRVEFMTALVQLAVCKYVMPKEMDDVSDAVTRLLEEHLRPRVRALEDVNDFRRRVCYRQDVTELLSEDRRGAAPSEMLCEMFEIAAASDNAKRGRGTRSGLTRAESELLNLTEWKALLRALGLIDADFSEANATLCFAWSRTAVVDDATPKGHLRETHLTREGVFEALCRVAVLKALPTDEELKEAGAADAGEYMEDLRQRDATSYTKLLQERQGAWGQPPPQPEERCVAHLFALITRRVELMGGVKKLKARITGSE